MRLLQLDFLRFIAVMLVLGRHMVACPEQSSTGWAWFSQLWQQGGWVGVDMFFVLSGFLVSGLLFREYDKYKSLDIWRFLIRRGFKIYPAFWALIAATVVHNWLGFSSSHGNNLGSELLFIQNYVRGMWNHTWSLAVEEHFYLLLTGIVAILIWRHRSTKDPFSGIPALFAFTAIGCYLLRVITVHCAPYHHATHSFPTHLRIDSLMFGVLLAYSWQRNGLVRTEWVRDRAKMLIAIGALLLLPAFLFQLETTKWIPIFGFVSFYLGSGAILIGLLHCDLGNRSTIQFVSMLGTYSYSIYLWHMPVHDWFVPLVMNALPEGLQGNWFIYMSLYVCGSFALGVLLCKMIEAPALGLRDRWFPSRSKLALLDTKATGTEKRDGIGGLWMPARPIKPS